MKIDSFKRLYIHELKDLYSAENQLLKALPKMAKNATSPDLKHAFEEHLVETRGHVNRLEKIFKGLDFAPGGESCAAMKGLIEESEDAISTVEDPFVMDAALIAAAQRVEHYEMAGYGTVCTFAEQLGEVEAARLLAQTLNEEKMADEKLSKLALSTINVQAES